MKNKHIRHRISLSLIMIAALFTSVNATRMVGINENSRLYKKITPFVQNAVPAVGGCQIFPQNNYWNTPVNALPVHSLSAAWINSIGATRGFHMDFGSGTWNGGPIGIPFNIVSGSQTPQHTVDFYYPGESDSGPYPIPLNPAIEYGSDHHILSIDTEGCKLYEIYDAWQNSGNWFAGSGAIWDLNSNALRSDGWTSADAAGLPIFPGLVRYEEIVAGEITHALRFTTDCTANYYVWPARHVAQYGSCATPVPFGARFRLKANYDISGFSPQAQIILQAMKTYGIVLADNGSPWFVSGAPNENWNNDMLHELDIVTGNNFEAVNTAVLMVDVNSGVTSSSTVLVNSVLPTSRSIPVGTTATIFNTVINAGIYPAIGLTLSMTSATAGTFSYQQTNCATNAIIGTPNPSLDLAPGGVLCYVLSFTPNAPFAATNVHIQAQASNAPPTNLLPGINTWLLRSTSVAGPDIIALTTTTDFHQIVCSGTNAFAVALSNVGVAATEDITVSANTGLATLPLNILISETNPGTGVVIGDNILQSVGAGDNRTVAVFVTFNGCVPFDPAANRIFIEFRDASNNVVGSTSTAVSTNR